MEFEGLSRRELQALCKRNKIPANITNVAMVESLKALTYVEGTEEVMQLSQSGTAQSSIESPEGKEVTSPRVLPTGGRTTRRRTTAAKAKEEPATLQPTTRTRRSTRKNIAKDADVAVPYPTETPATVQTTRKAAPLTSVCRKMESQFKECEEEEKKGALVTPAPSGVATRRRRGAKEESVVKKEYSTRRSVRISKKSVEVPVEVEVDNSGKDANMSLKESMDEASGTSGIDSITTLEENSKPTDGLEVVSSEKQQIQSDEHVDLGQDVENLVGKSELEDAPVVNSEGGVLEGETAIIEAADTTTIMEEMLEGEDESEVAVNAEVDEVEATDVNTTAVMEESLEDKVDIVDESAEVGELEATDVITTTVMEEILEDKIVDNITTMDEVLKGEDEPEVVNAGFDELEGEKAIDVDIITVTDEVLEGEDGLELEWKMCSDIDVLKFESTAEVDETSKNVEKIEGENELIKDLTNAEHKFNGSLDVSTNVEMALGVEAGFEVQVCDVETVADEGKDKSADDVSSDTENDEAEEVPDINAVNVESVVVEAKEHVPSEVGLWKEAGESSVDVALDLAASLTPHKASAAKASAPKERMVILSDNKENIGTESKVTHTKEKVKVAKKQPDVDLELLSLRKLTKMVKQLKITNEFVKNEKESKVNEQACARPALQALPENQLVNETQN